MTRVKKFWQTVEDRKFKNRFEPAYLSITDLLANVLYMICGRGLQRQGTLLLLAVTQKITKISIIALKIWANIKIADGAFADHNWVSKRLLIYNLLDFY